MKTKGKMNGVTWAAIITTLIVGYAVYDYKSEQVAESKKQEESIVVNLKEDQINEIEIESNGESLLVKRSADGWALEKPVKDWADNDAVDSFVKGLVTEKSSILELDTDAAKVDWKIYGLDGPKGKIKIRNQLNQEILVEVSDRKNFQGESYIRKNSEDKVLIASGTWTEKASKKAIDFRDKRLFRHTTAKIMGFSLDYKTDTGAKESYTIELKDSKWNLVKPSSYLLDQNKVRELITLIGDLKAIEFASEVEPSASEKQRLGISVPQMSLNVILKDNKKWHAQLGRDKDNNYFAINSEQKYLYKMDPSQAARLKGFSLDSLRNRQEAFGFNKSDVKKIIIANDLKKNEVMITEGSESEQYKNLLSKLQDLKISKFLDRRVNKLNLVKTHIELKDGLDKTVLNLTWTDSEKKGEYYMRSSLMNGDFLVDASSIDNLKLEEVTSGQAAK